MFRFFALIAAATLFCTIASAQQPSGTSASPAPGTHMDQSTVQTVGTTPNGAGATISNPRPSPVAGTALPTINSSNALVLNPPQPVTKTLSGGGLADPNDVADLLSPKPLKASKLSLIGGTVKNIDQIRDHMSVRVYGTGNMNVKFDQRTHFYRDGKETTQLAVKKGDRVYLDTQLFEGKIFAKNVHVETGNTPADASGQIVSYNAGSGDMVVHDDLAGTNVKFRVSPQTVIKSGTNTGSTSSLQPGTLIAVKFSPRSRSTGTADEVSIIAEPGTSFTYFGRVTHLDLRFGLLAIDNQADGKTYEVHLDGLVKVPDKVTVGSLVTVIARFEGRDYLVQSIEVNAGPDQAKAGNEDTDLSSPNDDQSQSSDHRKSKKKDKNKDDDPQ